MSPDVVHCDGCGQPGRRRLEHPCPDHWFFIESQIASRPKGEVHVVWACSEACRDKLWQRGPGKVSIDEAGSVRMRKRRDKKLVDIGCIRDDSTECDCPRCVGAEDAFWRDQGEQT